MALVGTPMACEDWVIAGEGIMTASVGSVWLERAD